MSTSLRLRVTVFGAAIFMASTAVANEHWRPTSVRDMARFSPDMQITDQKHFFVPGSQIAEINFVALRRDFQFLQHWDDAKIRHWVLDRFARVSEMQLRLRGIRSDSFNYDSHNVEVWSHPPTYKRAAVTNVQDDTGKVVGIIDLKGTGQSSQQSVDRQTQAYAQIMASHGDKDSELNGLRVIGHTDGMSTLGEAIAESARQKAVQEEFDIYNDAHGTSWQTVETYFIIKLPIKILRDNGKTEIAAIYARQGHWRGKSGLNSPKEIYYDDYGKRQSTLFDSVVDFGGVVLSNPELYPTYGNPKDMVDQNGVPDPQYSNVWRYSHETAHAENIEVAVKNHFESMLKPIRAKHAKITPLIPNEETRRDHVGHLNVRDPRARAAVRLAYRNYLSTHPGHSNEKAFRANDKACESFLKE